MNPHRYRAFNNAMSSLSGQHLPEQVFSNETMEYRFFQSDHMFSSSFVKVVMDFLSLSNSKSACIVNISQLRYSNGDETTAVFFEFGMTERQYGEQLRRGGPATGWLFGVDHFVAASDSGGWAIYCEKENDIAVAAFSKGDGGARLYSEPLAKLNAEPIEVVLAARGESVVPYNRLKESWRIGLLENYSN